MKLRIVSLTLLALCLALALPAMGDDYNNGPINGQVDAWTINFGFSVSNTITCCKVPGGGTLSGSVPDTLSFGAWLIPGDTISTVEVQIGTAAFGNDIFDGIVSLTQSNCFANGYGYNVCTETGTFNGPAIGGTGTDWLTLSNAVVPSGDPVYWDENSGIGCSSPGCPSQAQENTIGTIPSEAFTISSENTSTTTTNTTPEPSSVLLLGSGALGLAGVLRRKINL